MSWKILRVSILLLVLIGVGGRFLLDRYHSRSWNSTLWVGVFPINADGSDVTSRYVSSLDAEKFASIESFFTNEAQRQGLPFATPVHVQLMPAVTDLPPRLERQAGAFATMLWSLRMRWYSWRHGSGLATIRIFVLYHDPARTPEVPHSLGLQKGLVGVVYGFADESMTGSNAIVIAHEFLHTLGATDHYDLASGQPIFPQGYAEPERDPLLPQRFAEIMAGQRALTETTSEMPESLKQVRVGGVTAQEINWLRP